MDIIWGGGVERELVGYSYPVPQDNFMLRNNFGLCGPLLYGEVN
jgi:hypothetical protein